MNKVTVHKDELVTTVRANREQHRELFEKALDGWRKHAIDALDEHLDSLRAGRVADLRLYLPPPEDHTSDYDQVIRMLEMSVDKVIDLTHSEFAQYVMDDWGWKEQWTASNAGYTV